jgi:uncharacterized delta-60 repeat protein
VQRIEDRNLARRLAVPLLLPAVLLLADCGKTETETATPTAFAVLRLTNAGAADTTFAGGRAIAVTEIDAALFDFALAVAIQPVDNKILAGGSAGFSGQGSIALIRYDQNGVLDTTGFGTTGTGGVVRTPTPTGWTSASATAIAVDANAKIVLAALTFNASTGNTGIGLFRYNTNGTLDTTGFAAPNGFVTPKNIGPGAAGNMCALLLQGPSIIVAGGSSNGNIVLYRYDQNGALDMAFGTDMGGGSTTTNLGMGTSAASPSLALQGTKIIVATGNGSNTAVLRYSADGVLDTTFGGGTGMVTTDAGGTDFANAVAVQSDNKIVVAGHANLTSLTSDVSLIRYNPDGDLDTTFGTGGKVTTDLGGAFDNALSLALQSPSAANTAIIVSGNTGSGGFTKILVLRYTTAGVPDTTFGSNGVAVASVVGPGVAASGNAVAVQTGVGIVVAGYD